MHHKDHKDHKDKEEGQSPHGIESPEGSMPADKASSIAGMKKRSDELSKEILQSAIEVHRALGPGLLESAYEACLFHELTKRNLSVARQVPMPLTYKEISLDCGYRLDLLVEDLVIVELKSVERIESIHVAQLLTYLKLSHRWLGILINFNVTRIKDGFRRVVLG